MTNSRDRETRSFTHVLVTGVFAGITRAILAWIVNQLDL